MFSLRTHALIAGGLLAALILVAAGGNALQASGAVAEPVGLRWPAIILVFGLFLAFGFSAIPVMVMTAVRQNRPRGSGAAREPASTLEKVIIWCLWAMMAAGLLVAFPAMLADGFFA